MVAMPVNLTSSDCGGLIMCFMEYPNNLLDGWFWPLAMFGFSIVLFLATYELGTKRAYGTSSVFGMMGAILLTVIGLMNWYICSLFILAGVIGIVALIKGNDA